MVRAPLRVDAQLGLLVAQVHRYASQALSLIGMRSDTPEVESLDAAPLDVHPANVAASPLLLLAIRGDAKGLRGCLSSGASLDAVDRDGDSPLQLAAMGGVRVRCRRHAPAAQ